MFKSNAVLDALAEWLVLGSHSISDFDIIKLFVGPVKLLSFAICVGPLLIATPAHGSCGTLLLANTLCLILEKEEMPKI